MAFSGRDDNGDGIDDGLEADLEESYGPGWRERYPEVVDRARQATEEARATGRDIPESEYTRYMDETNPGWRENPEEVARVRAAEAGDGRTVYGSSPFSDPTDALAAQEDAYREAQKHGEIGTAIAGIPESDLDHYRYDPTTYEAAQEGPSAWEGVAADPAGLAAQRAALQGLQGAHAETGQVGAIEQAGLMRADLQDAYGRRAARAAAGTNVAALGGLAGLDADRMAGTAGALDVQAMQRGLGLLGQQGQVAGDLRGQLFDQSAQVREAQDAVDVRNVSRSNQQHADQAGSQTSANMYNAGASGRRFDTRAAALDILTGAEGRARDQAEQRRREAEQRQEDARGAAVGAATDTAQQVYSASTQPDEDPDEEVRRRGGTTREY